MSIEPPSVASAVGEAHLGPILGPVEIISSTDIGGEFGLAGSTARLLISRAGKQASVVAKIAARAAIEPEVGFYEQVAPSSPISVPAYLGSHLGSERGMLVLEDVGGSQGDVLAGCSDDVALELAAQLGALHRRWRSGTAPSVLPAHREPFRLRAERAAVLGPSISELVSFVERFGGRPAADGMPTVIHGDLHLDNVRVGSDGPVVLDWAEASWGSAEVDLAGLLTGVLRDDQRPRLWPLVFIVYGEAAQRPVSIPALRSALADRIAGSINWAGRMRQEGTGGRIEALVADALIQLEATIDLL